MKTKHGRRKKASQEHANSPQDAAAAPVSSPDATEDQTTDIRIKRLNLRFVAILLAAGVLVSAGLFLVHAYQTDRNADVLKERAEAALKKGDVSAGMKFLSQYVGLRPRDLDARVQLGDLLYEHAASGQQLLAAFRAYEGVLAEDASRAEVRRRHVDVAMQLQRHSDALAHLAVLVDVARQESGADAEPNGGDANGRRNGELGELFILAGECYRAQAKPSQAVGLCLQGLALAPDSIRGYRGLASALNAGSREAPQRDALLQSVPPEFQFEMKTASEPVRQNWAELESLFPAEESGATTSTPSVVEGVLSRMVERGRPTTNALLARAQFRLDFSDLEGSPSLETLQEKQRIRMEQARKDLDAALKISPDDREVLLLAAEVAFAQAEAAKSQGEPADEFLSDARKHAAHGLEQSPPDLRFYLTLGRLELITDGEPEEQYRRAQEHYEAALNAHPEVAGEGTPRERLATARIAGDIRWRLADVLITRAQLAGPPADRELLSRAREELKSFQQTGTRSPLIEFLTARLMLAEQTDQHNRWYRVSQTLQNIRHDMRSRRDLVRRIDLMLGECYEQLANPDARVNVFKRALADDPLWPQGRLALASALVAQDRIDDALQEYRFVSGAPGVLLQMARLMILQNASRPESAERPRQWGPVLRLLDEAEKREPDNPLGPVLRAQVLSLQKKYDEARQVLEVAREQHPDEAGLWVALSALELRRDDRAPQERLRDAEQILVQAGQQIGDSVDLRLAAADLAIARGSEASLALVELEAENERFPPAERLRLLEGLARAHGRAKNPDDARRLWHQLATENPHELKYQLVAAELAYGNQDLDELRRVLTRIRQIEGPNGANGNVFKTTLLIHDARSKLAETGARATADPGRLLARPRELLQRAAQERPSWSLIPQMMGTVEELLGNRELAVQHYQKAISLGNHSPAAILPVVEFLHERERYAEADRLLAEVAQERPDVIAGDLARLQAETAWRQGDFDRALSVARAPSKGPGVAEDSVWRAQVLFAQYQRLLAEGDREQEARELLREAEQLYRDAIELEPESPAVWLAYVNHLVRLDENDRAQAVIREAQTRLPSEPKHLAPMTLGRCYEAVNSPERAEEQYQRALASGSNELGVRMLLADFYRRRGDAAAAQQHVDWILDPGSNAPDSAVEWANEQKALFIAAQGSYQDAMKALDMLRPRGSAKPSVSNLRTRASILASRGTNRDQRTLIELLEQIADQQSLRPAERLQLARLYGEAGDTAASDRIVRQLIADFPENAVFLAWHAERLLARGMPQQAAEWIRRIERLQPESFGTVGLRAKLLAAMGKTDEAVDVLKEGLRNQAAVSSSDALRELVVRGESEAALGLLEEIASERDDQAALDAVADARAAFTMGNDDKALRIIEGYVRSNTLEAAMLRMNYKSAADLLVEFGRHKDAEAIYREYVERAEAPQEILNVIPYVVRQGRLDDALDLCEEAAAICKPQAVAVMSLLVLREGEPSQAHFDRVERWLMTAGRDVPDSMFMAAQVASLRDLQGRYAEAEDLYRAMLAKSRRAVLPLNNLAWLLALQRKNLAEAERLANLAIEVAGPLATLLDTRGTVYFALGRHERAISDFEASVSADPSPATYFHLAQAYLEAGDRDAARQAFAKADEAGLRGAMLHALEQPAYERLKSTLVAAGLSSTR